MNTEFLKNHLNEKIGNKLWLDSCLAGSHEFFPYEIKSKKKSNIYPLELQPTHQGDFLPRPSGNDPLYTVNIPIKNQIGDNNYGKITDLISLLMNESFGTSDSVSKNEAQKRFAVVIGINRIASIDPKLNRKFAKYIANIPKINEIAYRCFGFFIMVEWEKKNPTQIVSPADRAFMLLKIFSKQVAEVVRSNIESKEEISSKISIPYQDIRETIKNSKCTTEFINHFCRVKKLSPIYYAVMDADCLKLRKVTGLFSRYDALLKKYGYVSFASLGYSLKNNELPLIKLGVKIDMLVRQATTSVFPFGAYFPEPCTIFRICRPEERTNYLPSLSFLGDGNNLENRRLIKNGIKNNVFDQTSCFLADGGVVSITPDRMFSDKVRAVTILTKDLLKQKKNLQSLRGISQSHAFPKQWADNLYVGLDFSTSQVTDTTAPMTHIFSVYDPISRMFNEPGRFSKTTFNNIIHNFYSPLSDGQQNTVNTAMARLWGLGMEKEMIYQIVLAAERSGQAIYQELSSYQ